MKIENYLKNFNENVVTLVGPMLRTRTQFNEPVIFVDGGKNAQCDNLGYSIGDNDSYHARLDYTLPTEKDYSDLSYVLSHCHKFKNLYLYGFLGGRKDHELINLGELHHLLVNGFNTRAIIDESVLAFSAGEWKIELNQAFSLICFIPTTVQLEGCIKYPLHNQTLKPFCSHGLSNIASGKFILKINNPCFIFLIT